MKTSFESVMILFGGVSTEHEISLKSAYNIIKALRQSAYRLIRVGINRQGKWILFKGPDEMLLDGSWENYSGEYAETDLDKTGDPGRGLSVRDFIEMVAGEIPDVVFPAIHGINCEDGTVQGLLELAGLPYVGCDVTASSLGMDKMQSRRIFASRGIPVCKTLPLYRKQIETQFTEIREEIREKIGFPCFIKPNNGGSSVGTYKVDGSHDLDEKLLAAASYDHLILVEEYVDAREIEVAVLGNEDPILAPPGEIVKSEDIEFYDYKAKYLDADSANLAIPATIDDESRDLILAYAKEAYQSLGCSGLARIDFFLDKKDSRILLNEINTLPGFTPISLYPKAMEAAGIGAAKLVEELCRYAIEYKKMKSRTESI